MGFEPALDAADERFRSVTKLINNMYGLEVPREMSQLAHLVGPILRKSFPNMEREVSSFLDVHKNTVYIAFGQHALPAPGDIKMILATLFKLKKEGALDGIIWARIDSDMLPQDINEDLSLIMDDGKNITDFLMLPWAPQFAILQHPSTIMFIGHGGAGSIHESLYSRKRMFVFPFFADQSYHGQMLEKNGLGSYIQTENIKYTKSDYDTLYNRLKRVLLDETGDIQNAVDRYGTMLQIRSTHAVTNSVDILEECLFSSNDEGVLWYRQGIEQELNWLKQNDIDLYLVLAVFGLGGYKAFKRYFTTKPKMKTN
jgi:hypothetical protein